MRKIWLALAALAVVYAGLATLPARADNVPSVQPGDRVLGKADAPITIFEYFSLTCPHCAEFEQDDYPKLKAQWIDTGKAKIVYRDYPLDRNALKAAMVARCAPPDHYAAFVQVLFQTQMDWGMNADPTQALKRIALLGGISEDKFNQCINDDALSKKIVAEEYAAQKDYGVDSTPTFFINGKKVVGALPYDDFVKELEGKSTVAATGPSTQAGAAAPAATSPEATPPEATPPNAATPSAPAEAKTAPAPAAAPSVMERVRQWLGQLYHKYI
jgi:protein-disulfide isomerase